MERVGSQTGWFVAIAVLLLVFFVGPCDRAGPPGEPSGSVRVLDRVVDTVVRIVERAPIRVTLPREVRGVTEEVVVIDTIWVTPDTMQVDTVGVEQAFASHIDTTVGTDTIRVSDSLLIRAGRGPISVRRLASLIELRPPPDSLFDVTRQVIIQSIEYRQRPWLETVGIGTLGAAGGILAFIIGKELLKDGGP